MHLIVRAIFFPFSSGRAEGAGLDGDSADRTIIRVAAMRVVI
jgi:hypothetical protein